jgi:hypothetical protein
MMMNKRRLTPSVAPDFIPEVPKNKRRMHRSSEVSSGIVMPIDVSFIDKKISEVEELLSELYKLREYFEQKNSARQEIPSYFA